jgi:CIC family chloride channel protein
VDRLTSKLRAAFRTTTQTALEASNRLRLPGPSVLPVTGAVVGLYAGLAAGLFANLIGLFSGIATSFGHTGVTRALGERLTEAFTSKAWHLEFAIVGAPLALAALLLSRVMKPGGPRDLVKQRLRILALLTLGALFLYYPIMALAALNHALGASHDLIAAITLLPWPAKLLVPMVGGMAVGRMLRDRPELHGHGVPEVVQAVKRSRDGLTAEAGLYKLVASALTVGTGGSAGREGPIVYGGAAFGSWVATTLGFSRRELGVLMAAGAGSGIAASFNAPIAGAIFALEIILRELEVKVFSPIILACVTATFMGRGLMGDAPMLNRVDYRLVGGWEILAYAVLGILCGLLAFAFVRLLHVQEGFWSGRTARFKLSRLLGALPAWQRAGLGGLMVGAMAVVNPTVWGSGHDYVNLAAVGELSLTFLASAWVLKMVATSITLGSGGSGGTFFPCTVIGAMAGGAFGHLIHLAFPAATAPSGAYAIVGMGGVVAGFTRGPLMGMMMFYELTGNYQIILPLMVTCTIASALCHALAERRAPPTLSDHELLQRTSARKLAVAAAPVAGATPLRELMELLVSAEDGALPVLASDGQLYGLARISELREEAHSVFHDAELSQLVKAIDVARRVPVLEAEGDLAVALDAMDAQDLDALPLRDGGGYGLLTRAAIRRYLALERARMDHPVAPTEV